jgi:endonuclease-8
MPDGEPLHHAAAALRAALVDRKMLRFEAPRLVGVVPQAGRIVERVECHGRHLEIEWDDRVVLHTHMRLSGSWHLYRAGATWRGPHRHLRALVATDGWEAVCFNAPVVETYRSPDASRHPGLGGLGPDLCRVDADLGRCVQLLLAYDDPKATLAHVLLDQRVFCGLGNVYRCEVLWACELSPFARVADLAEPDAVRLVNVAAGLLRANLRTAETVGRAVHGRTGQRCRRCGDTVESRGEQPRALSWCPGCQIRYDPRPAVRDPDDTPMDPHPAATIFLDDLHWRRTG